MSAFIALFVTMMDRDRPPVRPTSPREDALSLTMHAIAFGGGGDLYRRHADLGDALMLGTILIILLVLIIVGALPTWPHSNQWGYGPSGALGLILVILIILVLLGRL
jgi:hypothetical protein